MFRLYRHVKDLVILTSGTVVLGTISTYFWLIWLLVRSDYGSNQHCTVAVVPHSAFSVTSP